VPSPLCVSLHFQQCPTIVCITRRGRSGLWGKKRRTKLAMKDGDYHQLSIIYISSTFFVQWVSYRPYQIWTCLYHIFYNKLGTILFMCICSYSLPCVCLNFEWLHYTIERWWIRFRKWSTLSFLPYVLLSH